MKPVHMHYTLRRPVVWATRRLVAWATPVALAVLLAAGAAPLRAENSPSPPQQAAGESDARWSKVSVQLPTSTAQFPGGEGAVIANSQCLMCHSVGMVLRQPARTQQQWKETINKMRTAYGAPLPAEQVDALAAYLARLSADSSAGSDAERPTLDTGETAADGGAIFAARCAVCHQASGMGIPGAFPPLAGSNWVDGREAAVIQILLHGVQGSLTVNGVAYNGAMPTFGDQLSDVQIAAVVSYVRSQWGNKAGAVDAALVRAQRASSASRSQPWNGDADLTKVH
jgi:mono/diheme cytochrome c family protein